MSMIDKFVAAAKPSIFEGDATRWQIAGQRLAAAQQQYQELQEKIRHRREELGLPGLTEEEEQLMAELEQAITRLETSLESIEGRVEHSDRSN